jgi:WS/DGAT/MGAT family acyltransferase
MANKPLAYIDTTWLRMEEPTNLMVISGVMIFSTRMDYERLYAVIEQRLLRFDRFHQCVVRSQKDEDSYLWEDDPTFSLENHLLRITKPMSASKGALEELVSSLMGTPLDFTRPLWQMHLIEKYGKGSAVICRLHHVIADGIALVQVLLSLTDDSPNPAPVIQRERMEKIPSNVPGLREAGLEILADPSRIVDLAKLGAAGAAALGRLVLRIPDPPTIFKGHLGVAKRAAWSKPIPLDEVKEIGRATGSTVNDVLVAAMTGALRQYLLERDQIVTDLEIRAVIPVNLRPLESYNDLGNRFGLVFLSLPVGIADPLNRLAKLKSSMDDIKGTPEAVVVFGIATAIGMVPLDLQNLVVDIFQTKGTAIMTNVPGPREPRYLAGALLDTIMFWVPQSARLGLGVSILSYNGRVWLGIATDQGLVPDPERITQAFEDQFVQLSTIASQLEPPTLRGKLQRMNQQLDAALKALEEPGKAVPPPPQE